jgi:hypothetical protein
MPNIDIFKDIIEAVKKTSTPTTQAYDTPATVTRIEGDVAWVHIPGGVDETPVRLTIAAKAGDTVQLRVGGGTAWLVGNQSAPPTDDTKANEAIRKAQEASGVATDFVTDTQNGIFVHPKNNTADGVRITDSIEIIKGKLSFFKAWIDGELAKVRVGRADSGHVEISAKGLKVYSPQKIADVSYDESVNEYDQTTVSPYYTFGDRASGACGSYSFVGGEECVASKSHSAAFGIETIANIFGGFACGRFNKPGSFLFSVGKGQAQIDGMNSNAFTIDTNGNAAVAGKMQAITGYSTTTTRAMFLKDGTSTTSASVAAGGTLRVAVDVSRTGYTPMAIAGIQTSSQFTYFTATLSGNEAIVYIKNNGTTAATTPINLIIFYIASSAL